MLALSLRCWALVGAVAASGASAQVASTFSGTLSATDPTFNRPVEGSPPTSLSQAGTSVSYDVYPFYVTAPGHYVLRTLSAQFSVSQASYFDDTFIAAYEGSFAPSAPLANIIGASDDFFATGHLSLLSLDLTPGTQYFLVVTSFGNAQFGPYTGELAANGAPSSPVLGVVPEAPTWLLMLAPLAIGALRRRLGPKS